MSTAVHPQVQRSLAAIAITDAVGFSKWMSEDEDTALAIINQDLSIITELCTAFEGKILKTTGDGVLMYFVSGVQAVSCAIEIQKKFVSLAQNDGTAEHFTHRIGVHLGDIFFNQDDMMGTSVNIAARLEAEAKPGAICMSQVVYEVVKYRLKLDAIYAGELALKNINQSVSAYHVWPPEAMPNKSPEQVSEAILSLATPLNTALNALSSHPQNHRIKKLLYAAHHGVWVHDPDTLKGVSLKLLVESFTICHMSLAECQDSLNASLELLDQPELYNQLDAFILENIKYVYTQENTVGEARVVDAAPQVDIHNVGGTRVVDPTPQLESTSQQAPFSSPQPVLIQPVSAQREPSKIWRDLTSVIQDRRVTDAHIPIYKVIPRTLKEFYVEGRDGSRIDIAHASEVEKILKAHQADDASLHKAIAQKLDNSKDSICIKQLLYCACCGQWENHIDRIQSVPMLSLIQGLYQQVNNLELLRNRLHKILLHLESNTAYKRAASEAFREVQPLYSSASNLAHNRIHFRREKSFA
ncbi:MAG: adenylate/guanylate cyclase domain-containing protein [Phormidesmis sp.]